MPPPNPSSSKNYAAHYDKLDALQMENPGHQTADYPFHRVIVDDRTNTDRIDTDLETSSHTANQGGHQLQLWAYEASNTNITVAERLERANWVAERTERL